MKNLCSGTQCGGFQFLLILDLYGISFHAVIVFGKNVLFKSVLGRCAVPLLPKNLPSLHNTALIKIPDLILVCVIEDLF